MLFWRLDSVTSLGISRLDSKMELEANPCVKVLTVHLFEAVGGNSSDQRQPNGKEKLVSTSVFIAVS